VTNDNIIYEFTGLLRMLQQLIKKMESSHKQFMTMEQAMAQAAVNFKKQTEAMPNDLQEVKAILRDGFRLESRKDA
jgi:fumarylacetoacetate (FAA) hydrolase family protein